MGDFYTTAFLSQAQGEAEQGLFQEINRPSFSQECQKGEGVKTQENLLPELIRRSVDY